MSRSAGSYSSRCTARIAAAQDWMVRRHAVSVISRAVCLASERGAGLLAQRTDLRRAVHRGRRQEDAVRRSTIGEDGRETAGVRKCTLARRS